MVIPVAMVEKSWSLQRIIINIIGTIAIILVSDRNDDCIDFIMMCGVVFFFLVHDFDQKDCTNMVLF